MTIDTNIAYGDHERYRLDRYSPESSENAPVIVFFHGGSWKGGDKKQYAFLGKSLARHGYIALLPNYRLFPDVKFPELIEDAALVVIWAVRQYPHSPIFVMGHSSGAHMAAMVAYDGSFLKKVGLDSSQLSGLIGISGPYNFTPRPDLRPIFVGSPRQSWNPVSYVTDAAVPTLLIHGALDMIVVARNARLLADRLQQRGGSVTLKVVPCFEHFLTMLPFMRGLEWITGTQSALKNFIAENS